MHGRAKVQTTAEQQEAKRQERAKKALLYTEATSKIYSKRSAGEHDDRGLKLTEAVLTPNPEILTLWNYRREIYLKKIEIDSEEDVQKCLEAELSFLQSCLQVNPKAYGIWLHREWVMLNIPNPNWKREQELCKLFLKYDERNFHCWDYRRFVIKHAGVSVQEELAFTTNKIEDNFSNYSSWHYRSQLLPLAQGSEESPLPKEVEDKEFELVQNAFFTDPGDQSAWFYHNWLLGKADPSLAILCLLAFRDEPKVAVVFNKKVKIPDCSDVTVRVNNEKVGVVACHAPNAPPSWPATLWVCTLPPASIPSAESVEVGLEWQGLQTVCRIENSNVGQSTNLPAVEESFRTKLVENEVLKRELEICKELLQLEPDNKWCLLTTLVLSQSVDPLSFYDEILGNFDCLVKNDPYRRGYYLDRRSKFVCQVAILEHLKKNGQRLDLSNKGLTRLSCSELMCSAREVDLSGNPLQSACSDLGYLLSAEALDLSSTGVHSVQLDGVDSARLRTLSLENNAICKPEDLEGLRGCRVTKLSLKGNPLVDKMAEDDLATLVKGLCPELSEFNGKQLHAVGVLEA